MSTPGFLRNMSVDCCHCVLSSWPFASLYTLWFASRLCYWRAARATVVTPPARTPWSPSAPCSSSPSRAPAPAAGRTPPSWKPWGCAALAEAVSPPPTGTSWPATARSAAERRRPPQSPSRLLIFWRVWPWIPGCSTLTEPSCPNPFWHALFSQCLSCAQSLSPAQMAGQDPAVLSKGLMKFFTSLCNSQHMENLDSFNVFSCHKNNTRMILPLLGSRRMDAASHEPGHVVHLLGGTCASLTRLIMFYGLPRRLLCSRVKAERRWQERPSAQQ